MNKQYIISERAHFMCPNMHFGILIKMKEQYNIEKVTKVLHMIAGSHPFLKCVISLDSEKDKLFYDVGEQSKIEITEKNDSSALWSDYNKIGKQDWNVFQNGLLKVWLYPEKEGFQALFIAHHLLGDGRSVLSLACEFANSYVSGINTPLVEERLIQSKGDLPAGSELSFISKCIVNHANKQWRKETRTVSYQEYSNFVRQFAAENPVGHECFLVDENDVESIKNRCKENAVSVNDFLLARLFRSSKSKKIIIAVDIRSKLNCYVQGAMGNYASAISVTCKEKDNNILKRAKSIHKQIQQYINDDKKLMTILACYLNMEPDLIDAAAISSMGEFDSKSGKFVGGTILGYKKRDGISVTNLGSISCDAMQYAMFIPPASPATIQTIGVLTVTGTRQLCSSYYSNTILKCIIKEQLKSMVI